MGLKESISNIDNGEEVWLPIDGYEGIYEVSNFGRIRSLDRHVKYSNGAVAFTKGKILSPEITKKGVGYKRVMLCHHGKHERVFVHRAVAKVFVSNDYDKPYVNHIDGNKLNNNFKNLEWCTISENTKHAVENGLIKLGEDRVDSKLTNDTVIKIKEELAKNNKNQKQIADMFGLEKHAVQRIYSGKCYSKIGGKVLDRTIKLKLTPEAVSEIKSLINTGMYSNQEVADKFNVSKATIGKVRLEKSWGDVMPHIIYRGNRRIKMTKEKADEVRRLINVEKVNRSDVAKMFNVSRSIINQIATNQTWK